MIDAIVIGAGQSGLTAARALTDHHLTPVVLEAGPDPVGSWSHYYDSLTLFSPAQHSSMPGLGFPAEPDHYPHRDEVVDYLRRYAKTLDADIRTNTTVTTVESHPDQGFVVHTGDGQQLHTAGIVSATGSFGNPYVPELPGGDKFQGTVLHAADYRRPEHYSGQRVIVVGAGNSAVQIAYELADHATVTLATHNPINFLPQHRDGHDIHHWLVSTGFDQLPPEWLIRYVGGTLVMDTGDYQHALTTGRMDRRPMFTSFDTDAIVWADGTREPVDTVLFATGYRPNLGYLTELGALADGYPLHNAGISTTHPGLAYVGLEFQRTFSSNTLRGVHRDAEHVTTALAAHINRAPAKVGL
ncbi:NAD(P)/FAD-dependent oxidoreductase [Nocardia farcinica]|uniref:flavin-containing monooxygenase n=1 Tax=Nocardia TaxID=1817 RepID=UPI000A39379D|nr:MULTISPECIES: NAD(P)/FAD-dependent oxidoreductase [Nocardia]UAK33337.1 NAD(P)/FAD-dependent oxidoreductase [Nocardia asteroides]MBF6072714.1 NAD(P)/FAD-dependent oxidoreductase [Nocardia farcinica]MBF6235137.1 NAD(P)/FAD-dependent oxidoreductase [Nocardia farcinica]MBF6253873.1 NAD(P)/FAD-dependent oxidoreductase [Nocardia farcinica]MBF6265316.1 NAD(P)/FAD-dependent oxidoreductase [Nocardia farcinica]